MCCKILFMYVDYSLYNQCWFHRVTSKEIGLNYIVLLCRILRGSQFKEKNAPNISNLDEKYKMRIY